MISSSSVYFEWLWSVLDIWPAWSIGNEISIRKRNHNGQFLHENRVEYIPRFSKKFTTMTNFEWTVKNMISPQNTYRVRMPDTSINSRSSVTQHLCWDVSSCHSGIDWKWTSKILEQFWPYIEHVPSVTRNYIPFVRDWLGMKKSSIELFFT